MSQNCHHGQQHIDHHHHHVGLAEGLTTKYVKKLQWVMGLSIIYLVSLVLGGFYSGSLALWADAGHKLADTASIALALAAAWFANLSSSPRKTFGYYRLEILAALINALGLMFVSGFILWEAFQRLFQQGHGHIHGGVMLGVALLGLLINLISAYILYPSREFNLNVKGALLHILTDVANSVGEMGAALAILWFGFNWLDALISLMISFLVLYNALRMMKEAFNILMEASPSRLSVPHIRDFILRRPGILDVHDLHVWTITTGKDALLAHVRVDKSLFHYESAQTLEKELRETFDLCHITVQLEPPDFKEAEIPF
jgi:cobalt-zinc-cadmium efflux system protein